MTAPVVFTGPSLTLQDRTEFADIRFLAPARQGDVLRVITDRPAAIGIIDGYFGDDLAVHQKEILEAMATGITIWGGGSMGALRAAELHSFGMRGVGMIFEGYKSGEISADADVAVTHGPEELGFVATSVSMVDVRATLAAVHRRRAMSEGRLRKILTAAQQLHFSERTWEAIAVEVHKTPSARQRLEATLCASEIQQKRLDAIELIRRLLAGSDGPLKGVLPPPMTTYYRQIRYRALSGNP